MLLVMINDQEHDGGHQPLGSDEQVFFFSGREAAHCLEQLSLRQGARVDQADGQFHQSGVPHWIRT